MSGKSENIIELKHISKVYSDNGFKAVDDFNLEVKRGEFVTFLGPTFLNDSHAANTTSSSASSINLNSKSTLV